MTINTYGASKDGSRARGCGGVLHDIHGGLGLYSVFRES